MLPFMFSRKPQTGIIVKERKADGEMVENQDDPSDSAALEACAEDALKAISMKDSKMLAKAMQSAFEIMDSQPHVEGEHLNESNE